MSNYKDWIDAIDLKVDYFSAFMKAWIAFNAWYESGEIAVTRKEIILNQLLTTQIDLKLILLGC